MSREITGVTFATTVADLCDAVKSRFVGKNENAKLEAVSNSKNSNSKSSNSKNSNSKSSNSKNSNSKNSNSKNSNSKGKSEPCYYTFTGDLCPGPSFDQCPAGSRCDIDVGACVSAPRNDCITDNSKRGPLPEGAGEQGSRGNNGTAGNGGGRRRTYRKKGRRSRTRKN